jgi:hypothetical protein
MYKPYGYLIVTYFLAYLGSLPNGHLFSYLLPTYRSYFLQHALVTKVKPDLTQLRFIHNWSHMRHIQWMVFLVCAGSSW